MVVCWESYTPMPSALAMNRHHASNQRSANISKLHEIRGLTETYKAVNACSNASSNHHSPSAASHQQTKRLGTNTAVILDSTTATGASRPEIQRRAPPSNDERPTVDCPNGVLQSNYNVYHVWRAIGSV